METKQEQKVYLSCADTAKYVRKALKEAFPKQKFSVRSSVYSGGASIDVSWENGVSTKVVDPIIKQFAGAGFDGMIDYKFYYDHWVLPDGTVQIAKSEGSSCTGGVYSGVDNEKPHPEAKLVSWGADYVFAHRDISDDIKEDAAKTLAKHYGLEFNGLNDQVKSEVLTSGLYDNWYGVTNRILWEKDLTNYKGIKTNKCDAGQIPDFWDVVQEVK